MSYIGRNPKVRSITCEGFADFTAADASTKREGRLVYVQDVNKYYIDDGSALSLIQSGTISTLSGVSIENPTRLDMKIGTEADLITYADSGGGNASSGQLCYSSDTKKVFVVIDNALVELTNQGGGGALGFWQQELNTMTYSDGAMPDLTVSGLTIGETYKVTINVGAVRTASAIDEIQRIEFDAVPDFGSFTIDFDGQVTNLIAFDATAGNVQSELEALSNIGVGNVSVTGSYADGFEIKFINALGAADQNEVTIGSSNLRSGVGPITNEIQNISYSVGGVVAGGYKLDLDGETTEDINYDASAADVKAALEALPSVDQVTVTDQGGSYDIEFGGALTGTNLPLMTSPFDSLSTTTQTGGAGTWGHGEGTVPFQGSTWDPAGWGYIFGQPSSQTVNPDGTLDLFNAGSDRLVSPARTGTFKYHYRVKSSNNNTLEFYKFTGAGSGYVTIENIALTAGVWAEGSGTTTMSNQKFWIYLQNDATLTFDYFRIWTDGNDSDLTVTPVQDGIPLGLNEIQQLDMGTAVSGEITVDFDGQTTQISADAAEATVKAQLEAMSNIDLVNVTKVGNVYDIEFDGTNAKTNVPQMTISASALYSATQTSGGGETWSEGEGTAPNLGASWEPTQWGFVFSSSPTQSVVDNGVLGKNWRWQGASTGTRFVSPALNGTYTIEVRLKSNSGTGNFDFELNTGAGSLTLIQSNSVPSTGTYYVFSVSQAFSNQRLTFYNNGPTDLEFDYIRVYDPATSTTASLITTQEGVPLAGSAVTVTPDTFEHGQAAQNSVITDPFGCNVIHSGKVITQAKYFPPAGATEDAAASVSNSKYFVAEDTTVTVEAEGLSGTPERIYRGATNIIVESGATQNP